MAFLVTTKKSISDLESPHFQMFSAKCRKCKIGKRDGHGKSRNCHGKVMGKKVCGNPVNTIRCLPKKFKKIEMPISTVVSGYHLICLGKI